MGLRWSRTPPAGAWHKGRVSRSEDQINGSPVFTAARGGGAACRYVVRFRYLYAAVCLPCILLCTLQVSAECRRKPKANRGIIPYKGATGSCCKARQGMAWQGWRPLIDLPGLEIFLSSIAAEFSSIETRTQASVIGRRRRGEARPSI